MMTAEISGLASVQAKLEQLEKKGAKKAIRKGVGAGVRVFARGAKARVRRGPGKLGGLLRKSIGSKVKTFRSGVVVGIIGPRKGFLTITAKGKRVDPVKYGHIEERGRTEVRVKKKKVLADGKDVFGVKVKHYPGHPFMRPTLEQDAGAVQAQMAVATMRAINAEVKKQ